MEFWPEQIIHLKSARRNWRRKRKKRKRSSASWRKRILLPGKWRTIFSRKISAGEIIFLFFLQGNCFVEALTLFNRVLN